VSFDPALYSSARGNWGTPAALFDRLDAEFGFEIDAAALSNTAKIANYIGPDHKDWTRRDCLHNAWPGDGPAFMNPPYGRQVGEFVRAGCSEGRRRVVVLLILARTDTSWWHDYAMQAAELRFIRGRVKFIDPDTGEGEHPCPAPSVVVVFRPEHEGPPVIGAMVRP